MAYPSGRRRSLRSPGTILSLWLSLMLTVALVAVLSAGPAAAASLDQFVFKGRGYGHGVGMSQWGAWAAARDGKDFRWILGFYYPGTSLDPQPDVELKVKLSSEPSRAISELTQEFSSVDLRSTFNAGTLVLGTAGGEVSQAVEQATLVTVVPKEAGLEVAIGGQVRPGLYSWAELRPAAGGRVSLQFRSGATVYAATEYWGKGRVVPSTSSQGKLNAFNLVPLERYVRAIAEVENDWAVSTSSRYAPEAVKAQAVAARTYAVANMSPYLEDNQRDQVYRGYTFEAQRPGIAQAAADTAGLVLRYQGKVISAFYSSSSGGYTSMWSSGPQAYLPLQPDPYSLQAPPGNPGSAWTFTVSQAELSEKVAGLRDTSGRPINIGTISKVDVHSRETADLGSHVAALRLTGTGGTALISPAELRRPFGYAKMRSTLITEVENPGFTDVPPTHMYYDQIMRAAAESLVNGYPAGDFRPDVAVSRWQFAKMAVNLHNQLFPQDPIPLVDVSSGPFWDVAARPGTIGDESDWVAAAKKAGLVRGVSETQFRPYDPVRRDQVATMVVRAMGWEEEAAALSPDTPRFGDVADDSTHAAAATLLKSKGILQGYEIPPGSGEFFLRPEEPTKRMHIAVILTRILDLP